MHTSVTISVYFHRANEYKYFILLSLTLEMLLQQPGESAEADAG